MQRPRRSIGWLFAALTVAAVLAATAGVARASVSGAIFTTDSTGTVVNGNLYAAKADVYLDGGPQGNAPCSAAGLPDGDYYFQVTDCKFNDQSADGVQDSGEPLIPHWPITATGVDAGDLTAQTVSTQTDDFGCVSFAVSKFPNSGTQTVTLTEGNLGVDWTQTAPGNGTYDADGTSGAGRTHHSSRRRTFHRRSSVWRRD